jgi:hypothetical protein
MTTFLVSYDLRAPGQAYHSLIEEIKAPPTVGWAKPLESCFLVVTRESADALFNRLRAKIDQNDSILVIRVCRPYQAWTSQEVHDWIMENVPACQ